jgi:hypothetical protein
MGFLSRPDNRSKFTAPVLDIGSKIVALNFFICPKAEEPVTFSG